MAARRRTEPGSRDRDFEPGFDEPAEEGWRRAPRFEDDTPRSGLRAEPRLDDRPEPPRASRRAARPTRREAAEAEPSWEKPSRRESARTAADRAEERNLPSRPSRRPSARPPQATPSPSRRGGVSSTRSTRFLPEEVGNVLRRRTAEVLGLVILGAAFLMLVALGSWSADDPSLSRSAAAAPANLLGRSGAAAADLMMQIFGVACLALVLPMAARGWLMLTHRTPGRERLRLFAWLAGVVCACGFAACLPAFGTWPLPNGLGGVLGDGVLAVPAALWGGWLSSLDYILTGGVFLAAALVALPVSIGVGFGEPDVLDLPPAAEEPEEDPPSSLTLGALAHGALALRARLWTARGKASRGGVVATLREMVGLDGEEPDLQPRRVRDEPNFGVSPLETFQPETIVPEPEDPFDVPDEPPPVPVSRSERRPPLRSIRGGRAEAEEARRRYQIPPLDLLGTPPPNRGPSVPPEELEEASRDLESVLEDFGVRGAIVNARPGPVVTLYELEPAPGIKSSRVIGLADDIARSMSAVSARVAVIPGKNAIGIELPNPRRDKVLLREILTARDFGETALKLAIALGKTIGGEPVIVDLARMPHLLVAGTTGSGKSVAINTMILSLLYRHRPEQCRLIMIDPKMLELSVYDGIPHLLSPVVTDPKKAVVALKWAVREMEERYKKMSKVGVRNIDGFNARVLEAQAKGEAIVRTVQTGFDRETGEAVYEREEMDLEPLPYIVVVVDEMADLMMVAGKEIEGAIQRLAQMARAAGIHLIMATQRPSVDVITGTIKANFPTRISFQVTSRIDSRTILGEMGAEQLLGQGDMLYMAGGGRISRVHGPFVSDQEVERVVEHLKRQGAPAYLEAVTTDLDAEGEDTPVFDRGASGGGEEGGDLFDQAVAVVMRDGKCSTSYIQRRLQIGYNRAASLVERMEKEGLVGPANHAGKREILADREGEDY
ncbi:DNA translocase FtsK [Ancylobacter lacus]|uniref:DNA translocase FtsK n=1 Tax=Ancylobacter lacus TaxID=2579970 RepID=UPI001BCCD010|nr:DNA translocase FtsK [Ancylobacter lacus]MBS7537715.1 DNA translocase FtsK 4TM domain-containing protein [Ancylobacter lacus]